MEVAIGVSMIGVFTGGIVLLRKGGINALLEAVGVWCLVQRDRRLASKAAEPVSRARWQREVGV